MNTINLLKALMEIDSSTIEGGNKAIAYAKEYLETMGIKGEILEHNGYKSYVCEIGEGEKTLILNGHLDVVSGKEKMFQPYEKEGKIYGRGSADMKAGCAAMINTMIKLKDKKLPCKVMLQLVSDEELGGLNGSKILSEKGYLGDFVICGEPTQLGIGVQAKGFMRVDIEVGGKSAHGSRPWEGENAILKAIKIYEKILNLPFMKENTSLYEGSSVNLAIIEGGEVYNKVPEQCRIGLDIRHVPHLDPMEIIEEIKENIDGLVTVKLIGQSVNTSSENEYVLKLKNSIKKESNIKDVNIFGQHGSADTRFFAKYKIPTVEFGPVGDSWHGDAEYVAIASIIDYEEILEDFIMNF